MSRIIYSMSVSLDGYVETPTRDIGWTAPDDELHAFFNDMARATGTFLHGRRMYELMSAYWPTADEDPSAPPVIADFARIWREKPKVVFSKTLESVAWNSRLARDVIPEEIARMKQQPGDDMSVDGPTLAATFIRLGLVDEYGLFVFPIVLGGGTPFFPPLDHPLNLKLVETRTFSSGVVYLRYRAAR